MSIRKCPNCKAPIPLKWLLLNKGGKIYTCNQCTMELDKHYNSIAFLAQIFSCSLLSTFIPKSNAILDFLIVFVPSALFSMLIYIISVEITLPDIPLRPIDPFSGEGEKWRPLYDELKGRVMERIGPLTESISPAGNVIWKRDSMFCEVNFTRNWMEVGLFSDRVRRERDPIRWLRMSADCFKLDLAVKDDSNFPDITDWLVESYRLTGK